MGRDYRFRKRSVWLKAFDYVRSFLAVLGLSVTLYYARTGDVLSGWALYLIHNPIGILADLFSTIVTGT